MRKQVMQWFMKKLNFINVSGRINAVTLQCSPCVGTHATNATQQASEWYYQTIHLFLFVQVPDGCIDRDNKCAEVANNGYCSSFLAPILAAICPASCGYCLDGNGPSKWDSALRLFKDRKFNLIAVDGQWGPWANHYYRPDRNSPHQRTRQCNNPRPINGGKPCPGSAHETHVG